MNVLTTLDQLQYGKTFRVFGQEGEWRKTSGIFDRQHFNGERYTGKDQETWERIFIDREETLIVVDDTDLISQAITVKICDTLLINS